MARTKAPLFSLDASGSIGGAIVFSRWKGRSYARELVTPHNPQSGLQTGMRASMKFVTQIYASLSSTIKGHWATAAKADNITALDAMVRENQTRMRQNFGMIQDPTNTPGAPELAPAGPGAAAQPKSLLVNWTDSVSPNDWCTFIFMKAGGVVTPDVSNCIQIVPHGVQQYTVPRLITGTVYHFKLMGCDTLGKLGTVTADFTGTPT